MSVGNRLFVEAEDNLKAHQRFVIAKLQEGKGAWNTWRTSNSRELIDLREVDFTTVEHHQTDYSGYQFGGLILFDKATFGDNIKFSGATFDTDISFSQATFGDNIYFDNTTFGGKIFFSKTTFGDNILFYRATFAGEIYFNEATFGDNIYFNKATFGDNTQFKEANFGDNTQFKEANFGNNTQFKEANFGNNTQFKEANFGDDISFEEATFGDGIYFIEATFGDNINFSKATFRSKVTFSGMSKGNSFNLSLATFGDIPGVTLRSEDDKVGFNLAGSTFSIDGHANINTFSKIQVLKSIADATASINESRDLFILQRKAERSIAWDEWSKGYVPFGYKLQHIQASIMAFLFGLFSDFGRSIFQPIAWLIGCNIFFYYVYTWLIDRDLSDIETSSLRDFTLTNSLPFGRLLNPAFDSSVKILFAHTDEIIVIPFSIQLTGIAQGLISVVMLFLIGLGIRNYFKIS